MQPSATSQALQRAEQAFRRRPGRAVGDDVPATAVLGPGLRQLIEAPWGAAMQTDLPRSLGGDGDGVTPGWLLRAGLASCLGTAIALRAARTGVGLRRLQVQARSRSDARGLLGDGPVGPLQIELEVQIDGDDADAATLRELVAWADAHSPVSDTVRRAFDLSLQVVVATP